MAGKTQSIVNALHYDSPVFADLETTGTDNRKHSIAQIGAFHPDSGEKFETKLRFDEKAAEPIALETFGYDREVWMGEATSLRAGLALFEEFLRSKASLEKTSRRGNTYRVACLIGWRIDRFDAPFLIETFGKYDIFAPFDLRVFDAMQLAMWVYPGLEDYTLSGVAEHLDIPNENAHDALADVLMTYEITRFILNEVFDPSSLPDWCLPF